MINRHRIAGRPAHLRHGLLALMLAFAASASSAADKIPAAAMEEARKAVAELTGGVGGELLKAIESSGPLRAIVVCKYSVPEIASAVSRRSGARVTRVTLTPRNPSLSWPDAWEQKVLLDFNQRVARGEAAASLEYAEIVDEPVGRFFRYMKALPMQGVCLNCHGPREQMSESIRAQLDHEYPHDKSTGLLLGNVSGAVTFKKPL